MEKLYVIFLIALVVVHATARDIPNDNTKPSNALAPVEKTETVVKNADAPAVNGVGDEKNFITYGGMGGWAGVGYIGGVIPVMPVLGGSIPGASGLGGTGGLGGLGGAGGGTGLGGLGTAGGAGGAAGKVIP